MLKPCVYFQYGFSSGLYRQMLCVLDLICYHQL